MNFIRYNERKADALLKEVLDTSENKINFLDKIANKDIILYGAGNLGIMAVDLLSKINIVPKYIVDKNPSVHNKKINGVKVISPDEILEKDKKNAVFAICIVKFPFKEIAGFLKSINCEKIVSFWDVSEYYKKSMKMTNGWYFENLTLEKKYKLISFYNNLEDDISKASYVQVLYWRIRREEVLFENAKPNCNDMYFTKSIPYELKDNEYYIDCGASDGDIIDSFLKCVKGKFSKIIAFEPDPQNYKMLCQYIDTLKKNISKNILTYPYGLGLQNELSAFLVNRDKACRFINKEEDNSLESTKIELVKVDDILREKKVTFMKIHTEGMEYKILSGALETIARNRPIIAVTIYHNEESLIEIPNMLLEKLEGYKFYHRLHSYCGTDSILYAVPQERIKIK
ncbi:FkbM family methyltransferase [Clostridium hydrogenum]|uniref:FkbM family methyltransferase n=1 Tax=Clostridium hydrogenum TaxID=2855764 RepID=UPI001EEF01E7|nr:FkbM family methyltransferase [Clostridium hydrogenum]